MIHNVFYFVENLILHVDSLLHDDFPRFKMSVVNKNDNCAFGRLTRPGLQPAQNGRTALSYGNWPVSSNTCAAVCLMYFSVASAFSIKATTISPVTGIITLLDNHPIAIKNTGLDHGVAFNLALLNKLKIAIFDESLLVGHPYALSLAASFVVNRTIRRVFLPARILPAHPCRCRPACRSIGSRHRCGNLDGSSIARLADGRAIPPVTARRFQ